jgi:hypothetical protein
MGLSFWPSLGYTFAGSVMWELAGKRRRSALNDQLASGNRRHVPGRVAVFRMANLLVDRFALGMSVSDAACWCSSRRRRRPSSLSRSARASMA